LDGTFEKRFFPATRARTTNILAIVDETEGEIHMRYLAACAGKWPNRVHPKESLKPKGEIEPRTVEAPIEPARARPRSP
jgi:hypothetical protein